MLPRSGDAKLAAGCTRLGGHSQTLLRNVYPGWWLLAAMTFTVAVVSGLTFHSFTFYITPMEETFGWSRAQTSVAALVNMLAFSISAPLVGGWIDRWGIRSAALVGTPVTAAGVLLLHFTTSLWQFYPFRAIVAVGRTWLTFIPSFLVAITWFRRRRGVAVSIASAGGVIGGIVVLSVVTRLIDSLGREGSYLVTGIAVSVSVFPLLVVMRFTGEQPPKGDDGESGGPQGLGRPLVRVSGGVPHPDVLGDRRSLPPVLDGERRFPAAPGAVFRIPRAVPG